MNRLIPSTIPFLSANTPAVSKLESLLYASLRPRITGIPDPPQAQQGINVPGVRIAILFSGGLDCSVLARLVHDLLPANEAVDLINVAFENPRVHKLARDNPYEACPDRITGRASFDELATVCSDRQWRFLAVNVPYSETQQHRPEIANLMHPHNTEMDLSIASALYFAARGSGTLARRSNPKPRAYTTSARVLLSGLGADELFAGYTRHATAFKRAGHVGLLDEIELDVGRLGKRNLGRDDRVISHWGREARFPFLDEELVAWALSVPLTEKCDFGAEDTEVENDDDSRRLESGKKVLRCLAWRLGLKAAAAEKKRAIQFGARTAKMETGRTKGTQVLS
ncbi:asparagine synthase [Dissoconium aciculare CBS 342.82]|uniref:Asparagine synthase n=1 Tax=Dissoconium aciculare CBS 342.82 TaxID=1314786 RepID=A0A6J3MI09_9PEZI|nr:asparagine synthase [Dissoconium aciculare CBS 342.82]KAF1826537.1 asparagine synthase [Dissoconium aciculare CBS 342.82]